MISKQKVKATLTIRQLKVFVSLLRETKVTTKQLHKLHYDRAIHGLTLPNIYCQNITAGAH